MRRHAAAGMLLVLLGLALTACSVLLEACSAPSAGIRKDLTLLALQQRRALDAYLKMPCARASWAERPDGGAEPAPVLVLPMPEIPDARVPRCGLLADCVEEVAEATDACRDGAASGPACASKRRAAHSICREAGVL